MDKPYQNQIAHRVRKRESAPGLLKILEWSDKKTERGTLLAFIEIETADRDNAHIVKTLSSELTKQYFNALTEANEFAFEHALNRANIALKDILLSKPKSWLAKIHLAVMVVSGSEVHLTGVGRVRGFLAHRDRSVEILGESGAENNIGSAGRRPARVGAKSPNPIKLFSHVVSGQIGANDAVVLVNEPVLDYLSLERIRKTASEYEADAAAARFLELLALAPATKQFGVVCVKRAVKKEMARAWLGAEYAAEHAEIAGEKEAGPTNRTAGGGEQQALNYNYLRPSEAHIIKQGGWRPAGVFSALKDWAAKAGAYLRQYGGIALATALDGLNKGLAGLSSGVKKLPARANAAGRMLWLIIRDRRARRYYFDKLRLLVIRTAKNSGEYLKSLPEKLKSKWRILPRKQKIALIGLAALLLILIVSVAARARAIAKKNYEQNYQNLVAAVKQKSAQAEAALIYKDIILARAEIQAALALLAQLPQKSEGEKVRRGELQERIAQLSDKAEKKENLGALAPLVTITNEPPTGDGPAWLIAMAGRLFYLSANEPLPAEVNLKAGLFMPLPWPDAAKVQPKFALPFDEKNIIIFAAGKTVLFNITEETVKEKTIALPSQTAAMGSYFKNIYALVPAEHKLWRFRESGGSFGPRQNWLKHDYNLEGLTDLAVDGSIWLLAKGGHVRFLENGLETSGIQGQLAEPTGAGAKIFTRPNFSHLYIFDPKGKRIIKLTKEGVLAVQYVAPELENGRAFTVDEKEQNIFMASNDKIYRIPIK